MALTDEAIAKLRAMIQSGELPPGARLPPENQLATQIGISRGGVREAVKVLESARVLDVRRGDGTYVTSLEPKLLLGLRGGRWGTFLNTGFRFRPDASTTQLAGHELTFGLGASFAVLPRRDVLDLMVEAPVGGAAPVRTRRRRTGRGGDRRGARTVRAPRRPTRRGALP